MGLTVEHGLWVAQYPYERRDIPKEAGFKWHGGGKDCSSGHCPACAAGLPLKRWWTGKPECAARLIEAADEKAKALLAGHAESVKASKAASADVEIPAPEGFDYLPFQRAGISYSLNHRNTLFGDEPGLGKTIQALGVINSCPEIQSVLVVVPATLRINWAREAGKWLVNRSNFSIFVVEHGTERKKTGNKVEKTIHHKDGTTTTKMMDETVAVASEIPEYANFVVVNYDLLSGRSLKNPDYAVYGPNLPGATARIWKPSPVQAQLMARTWDCIIVDEAHYLKNPKAARTIAVLGDKGNKKKKVLPKKGLVHRVSGRKLFLTGSPIPNKVAEIFPLLNALDPFQFDNFFTFGLRYCAGKQEYFGWNFDGASHLEELQEKLRSTIMVRRLKKEVLKELPPKRRQIIPLPVDGAAKLVKKEATLYAAHEAKLASLRDDVDFAHASGNEDAYKKAVKELKDASNVAFHEMSKVRRELAISKLPAIIEHIQNIFDQGIEKLVVWGHHHEMCNPIYEHFKDIAVRLTGEDTNIHERDRSVARFQTDPNCKLFVGSIKAAGVGLTLTAASYVIFAELDWVPLSISQAEDRCHRIGQHDSVFVQHLVVDGSLDARMAQRVVAKQEIADRALDSDTLLHVPVLPTKERRLRPMSYPATTPEIRHAAFMAMQLLDTNRWFNPADTGIGKKLTEVPELTDGQAWLATTLANKYQDKLPDNILVSLKIRPF